MSLIIGEDKIKYIYVGRNRIKSVNVGDDNIFSSDSAILPTRYTQIQCLTTSYINFRIDLRMVFEFRTMRFVLDSECIYLTSPRCIFSSGGNFSAITEQDTENNKINLILTYGSKNTTISDVSNFTTGLSNRCIYDIDFKNQKYTIGDYAGSLSRLYETDKYPICLGTHNAGAQSIQQRIYGAKIYQSGSLVNNFVPCISPDGVVGLYETFADFFTSNSLGRDTAGPTVS